MKLWVARVFVLATGVWLLWACSAGAGDHPDQTTLVMPAKDPALQQKLERVLQRAPFANLVKRKQLSVALVDLSRPDHLRYAGVDDDAMRYAASLPKIAILLGVFDQIDKGKVTYSRELKQKMELMIRRSDNRRSTELIELVGFQAIADVLQDPRYELYDPARNGGLWVGKDYGGDLGYWHRDPIHHISHGATARQVARFYVMLDRKMLVSPWASTEMKDILSKPAINHKFVLGLSRFTGASIFRKSGTWKQWHADSALVERRGKRYVAVALMESSTAKGVLSLLIQRLDGLVQSATD